ncbi:MAG TPA: hypothetical protein VFF16_17700 [Telluria sp.]|nr:hypothetical protein [Telluria sp.]
MYESRHQPPLSNARFARRLANHVAVACLLVVASVSLGMWGYVALEDLSLMDAFLNAAMLLGGMGPVDPPQTPAGKLFAGLFALYAGLIFIVTAALVFTPLLHRVLHRFHWTDKV